MAAPSPYFKIKPRSGGWRAFFYGRNGKLVWWSQIYDDYETAQDAVSFARKHAATAPLR